MATKDELSFFPTGCFYTAVIVAGVFTLSSSATEALAFARLIVPIRSIAAQIEHVELAHTGKTIAAERAALAALEAKMDQVLSLDKLLYLWDQKEEDNGLCTQTPACT